MFSAMPHIRLPIGDVTRSEVRARAFTIVGITIGAAFMIAIIIGPLLAAEIGFSALFYILTALGILAILVTIFFFPKIEKKELLAEETAILSYLKRPEIRKLFLSAAILSLTVNMFVFIYPYLSRSYYSGSWSYQLRCHRFTRRRNTL